MCSGILFGGGDSHLIWDNIGRFTYWTGFILIKQTLQPESASELYRLSNRRLSAKLVLTFAGRGVSHSQLVDPLQPKSRFSRPELLLFLSSSYSVLLTRLSGPHSRPSTTQKMWYRRESNPDLWICSQELWLLDRRGGRLHINICLYW
jgi:hypothetical protein